MIRTLVRRHWHGLVMLSALMGLAVIAPQVNAAGAPPSSVFVAWPEGQSAPELKLSAGRYPDGSWHLDLAASGFTFSDLCQAVEGPQTIGHAHVYDGAKKIASAFVPRVPLGHLAPGQHRFHVILRAQDHRALVGSDGLISAEILIIVPST
jgi:hypothetical protein